jgi:GNAT superfamily N-acetyltransferase
MTDEKEQQVQAPKPLDTKHQLADFDCGNTELNEWLKKRALKNENSGASRTYVVTLGDKVVAYYCLANGSIINITAPGKIRRNMPDPIPVMIIGRLAVDIHWQGKGSGYGLVRDAILRTLQAAKIAGIRAILVHAISQEAKQFYEKCGFIPSPIDPMILMIAITDALEAIEIR